ncbi:hypothetical protein EV421DRAFT_1114510 [Armillaria borealis]|uniref:Secreted protein n=1 Tax=Armillaria borealis TaxID=47425 RepID=A0AA39MJX7_9AGAR|nr:hypothetical protein EV421DRAFT_1114510 [Armillaria borealis]
MFTSVLAAVRPSTKPVWCSGRRLLLILLFSAMSSRRVFGTMGSLQSITVQPNQLECCVSVSNVNTPLSTYSQTAFLRSRAYHHLSRTPSRNAPSDPHLRN